MNRSPEQPRRALGKGLGALLPTRPATIAPQPAEPARDGAGVIQVPVDSIDANPHQPRRAFNPDRLQELARSMRANGLIQPLVVRRHGERLQLIAGERRLRAAQIVGMPQVPVIILDIPDDRLLEVALIENLQREDLNPIEAAKAFARLESDFHMSPETIGQRTGKDRTTIVNFVRLLQLPPEVQEMVEERRISAGHARCLLSLPTASLQKEVAERAVARGWSVREMERETKRLLAPPEPRPAEPQIDPNVKAAIQELERVLGTKVRIVERSKQKGQIEIEYYSGEDLDRLYGLIVGEPR